MFQLLRVDHRLIHGQVALSWVKALGTDAILVANDDIPTNDLRKSTLKLAKPADTKLVIKTVDESIEAINSGRTNKYKLFIIVETIHDSYRLAKACLQVTDINLGGTKAGPDTRAISKLINVTATDIRELDDLHRDGKKIEIRPVVGDRPISYRDAAKGIQP